MARTKKAIERLRAVFLESLAESGNVYSACERARLPRRTAYEWKKADDDFSKAWDQCIEEGIEGLIDEANRRAYVGTLRPVYQKGHKVGEIREYSDQLLMFLIKAKRPEYRDRAAVDVHVGLGLADRLEAARDRVDAKASRSARQGETFDGVSTRVVEDARRLRAALRLAALGDANGNAEK